MLKQYEELLIRDAAPAAQLPGRGTLLFLYTGSARNDNTAGNDRCRMEP